MNQRSFLGPSSHGVAPCVWFSSNSSKRNKHRSRYPFRAIRSGSCWQRNEFRSNDFWTRVLPGPVWRGILLLKQQNGWRIPLLRPQIPLEKGREMHVARFDYSETRLPAMHSGKLLRTSFRSQKAPELASVALCVTRQGGRSPWVTSIRSRSRGPQGPRLTFGRADLERRWAGPRGREGTPRRKKCAGCRLPAPPRVCSFAPATPRFPAPPRSGRVQSGWRCAGGTLARRRRSPRTRWRACGRACPRASPPGAAPCPCRRRS